MRHQKTLATKKRFHEITFLEQRSQYFELKRTDAAEYLRMDILFHCLGKKVHHPNRLLCNVFYFG